MLVVLAKLGTVEMTGQFALGLAVGAPVFLLTNLSLRSILATDVGSQHRFGDYLALRLLTVGLGLAVVVALVAVSGYREQTRLVCVLVAAAKAVEAVSDVLHGLMQRHERMDLLAGSVILRGALSLAALAGGLLLTGSLPWALVFLAAAWALVLLAYDVPQGARVLPGALRPRWHARDLGALTWLSLPLGLTAMLISLGATIPRYFVERYRGEDELGIFVAMVSLVVVGGTAVNAIGQSVSPRLAGEYAAGEHARARRLLAGLVALGLLLGGAGAAVAVMWGGEILAWLYRPEYARHAPVLVWIMAAAAASYAASFLGHAMTAARLLRVQLPLFAAVAGVALVASAVLVPGGGVRGAAQAILAAAVVQLALSGAVMARARGGLRAAGGSA
jgi:O-antigen/teichoic acid export membrane protein